MKKPVSIALKICRLVGLTSFLAIGSLFLLSLFRVPYATQVLFWIYGASFACYALAAVLAALCSRVQKAVEGTSVPVIAVNFVYYVVPVLALAVGAVAWIYSRGGIFPTLVGLLFFPSAYLIGAWVVSHPYDAVDSRSGIVKGTIFTCAFYLLSFLLHWGYDFLIFPYDWYLGLYLPFVACFLLLSNQSNLDAMLNQRKITQGMPQKIRRYNLFLALGMLVLLFLALFFMDSVVWAIQWLGTQIHGAISALLQWLIGDPGEVGEYTYMQDMGEAAQQGMGALPQGKTWPIWDVLFYLVIPAVVVFVFVWYRDQIWYAIREAAYRVGSWLLSLVVRLSRSGRQTTEDNVEYVDEYLDLVPPQQREKTAENRWKNKRQFARYLKNIKDPVAYTRACYRYVLSYFTSLGRKLEPSDTPRELGEKISSQWNQAQVQQITQRYEEVRYAQAVPSKEECDQYREDCLSLTQTR